MVKFSCYTTNLFSHYYNSLLECNSAALIHATIHLTYGISVIELGLVS